MPATRLIAAPIVAACAAVLCLSSPQAAKAQEGFVHAEGTRIVDGQGRPLLLRGMGLGGWMLQEGYMLQLGDLGQQHVIRGRIAELIGEEKTEAFYRAWLDNHTTKADIDALARWGFNSVRLPMHYGLLTLPIEDEPVAGRDTWKEDGFQRIDRLVDWVKANGMVLILDLHAAPGGQGTDLAISDRDPDTPSLWDSAENRRKTVALWRKLAERYADEPAVAGYDILNEPNWDLDGPGGGHGCESERNASLWELERDITAAIRQVDRHHLVIIEGNCWGNNYKGLPTLWDDNIAISFHKYWNRNDAASIAEITALRDARGAPIWLGESGENSNTWYRDAIRLVEDEGIGWAFWPLKKIGFNQPLEIEANPGWPALAAWLNGQGPRPDPAEAEATLMRLATHDVRFENNIVHPDVIDAIFRQPHDDTPQPFAEHRIGADGGRIAAVDYDMGRAGYAWSDTRDASYEPPSQRLWWNPGRTYRNDGVDTDRDDDGAPYVTDFGRDEWLTYSLEAGPGFTGRLLLSVRATKAARLSLSVNGGPASTVTVPAGQPEDWRDIAVPSVVLAPGRNLLTIRVDAGTVALRSIALQP